MPDLLSSDDKHVAEVITTVSAAARQAEQHLDPMIESRLPHCVSVLIPYTLLAGATKNARRKIEADVLRWTMKARCDHHWLSPDERNLRPGVDSLPILALGRSDDGVQVMCVQRCQHESTAFHQITWSVTYMPSPSDPRSLIRGALHNVDTEQKGGVEALATKLDGYPNKHLVMYPFGPPGNLTATLSRYVLPPNLLDLIPPQLNPPLADVHLWLLYRYEESGDVEGLHVCNGHWARFGTTLPKPDMPLQLRRFHYIDA